MQQCHCSGRCNIDRRRQNGKHVQDYLHRQQHSRRRKEAIQRKGQSRSHVTDSVILTFIFGFLQSHPVTLVQDYINKT